MKTCLQKLAQSTKLRKMSTETILPDIGFSREQKEYLQGYFTGLACSGMIPFVGHLPDGRITNMPAPGLVNGAANPELRRKRRFTARQFRISASRSFGSLNSMASTSGISLSRTRTRTNFPINRTRSGFAITGCFMSHRRRNRSCFAAGSRQVK